MTELYRHFRFHKEPEKLIDAVNDSLLQVGQELKGIQLPGGGSPKLDVYQTKVERFLRIAQIHQDAETSLPNLTAVWETALAAHDRLKFIGQFVDEADLNLVQSHYDQIRSELRRTIYAIYVTNLCLPNRHFETHSHLKTLADRADIPLEPSIIHAWFEVAIGGIYSNADKELAILFVSLGIIDVKQ